MDWKKETKGKGLILEPMLRIKFMLISHRIRKLEKKQVNLTNMMSSKRSKMPKIIHCLIPFVWSPLKAKYHEKVRFMTIFGVDNDWQRSKEGFSCWFTLSLVVGDRQVYSLSKTFVKLPPRKNSLFWTYFIF